MTLETGEAKIYQHLFVREAVVLPDGLLMEAEEKERKEEDMSEQGLLSTSWVLKQPCFLLGRSSS